MKIDLTRIFAHAFARRVAYVVVAALLAYIGIGKAHAQTWDQGSAWAQCTQQAADPFYGGNAGCYDNPAQSSVFLQAKPVGPGAWTYDAFPYAGNCTNRITQTTTRLPLTGSLQCINGCMYSYAQNADGETTQRSTNGDVCSNTKDNCPAGTFYNLLMNVCQPFEPECPDSQQAKDGICVPKESCPDGMVAVQGSTPGAISSGELYCKPKENECPPGNIKAPSGQCLPGEGQCAAGEAKKKDGTCGKDADGDGVADDDDGDDENDTTKPTFSGGDTCNAPPRCDGNPILCGQARIQWRIDCNTRKSRNVNGGSCGAPPVCTGEKCDAVESNQLTMQWRTACAVEKLAKGGAGEGGSNADLIAHMKAQRDAEIAAANADAAQGDGHEGVTESSIFAENTVDEFDPNMFGGSSPGMCSFSTTLELMGHPIELPGEFWMLASMIGWLTVACAYLWVAFQLG